MTLSEGHYRTLSEYLRGLVTINQPHTYHIGVQGQASYVHESVHFILIGECLLPNMIVLKLPVQCHSSPPPM